MNTTMMQPENETCFDWMRTAFAISIIMVVAIIAFIVVDSMPSAAPHRNAEETRLYLKEQQQAIQYTRDCDNSRLRRL